MCPGGIADYICKVRLAPCLHYRYGWLVLGFLTSRSRLSVLQLVLRIGLRISGCKWGDLWRKEFVKLVEHPPLFLHKEIICRGHMVVLVRLKTFHCIVAREAISIEFF